MNNNLKQIQKELEEARQKTERLEREERTIKIEKKLDLIKQSLADDETISKFLENSTIEDSKIIAEEIVMNFAKVCNNALPKLEEAKLKREKRNAKRKARLSEPSEESYETSNKEYSKCISDQSPYGG
jgi:hypothetical protein